MVSERTAAEIQGYDRLSELRAFDETKAGVKGVVDTGITKLPRIFIHPPENLDRITAPKNTQFSLPTVDLDGMERDPIRHQKIVEEIRDAAESWGFFQVVNHGIPVSDMEEMINGVRRFFEQDTEVKKQYYTRDTTKSVVYISNFELYKGSAPRWRDSIFFQMAPTPPLLEELPSVCREIVTDYSKKSMELGCSLFKILAEGLGLKPNHLLDMDCAEGLAMVCHYYPPCPEPELTIGAGKHSDNSFLTVLLQDNLGGLQVLHQDQWVDVPPIPGALVVNIGDFVQVMSNGKFKSVEHRVLVNKAGPRISLAGFFTPGPQPYSKQYGPIKELLSEENPPKYPSFTVEENTYFSHNKGLESTSPSLHFKL